MDNLKSAGSAIIGFGIFVGMVILFGLILAYGARIGFVIQPYINSLSLILFGINLLLIPLAWIRSIRGVIGFILFLSSYVYGLALFIYGFAVTLSLWGWFAVIVGLFFGGVGVIPVGMLAAIFNSEWEAFWNLLVIAILTVAIRIVGAALVASKEEADYKSQHIHVDDEYIDIEQEGINRSWKDVE